MKKRKLVAAIACRVGGTRLYGKPLQNLDVESGVTILDQLILSLKACSQIDEIVLGIAEGSENQIFVDFAHRYDTTYIIGSEKDVLYRLIQCGRISCATDIFRITSECPFFAWEMLEPLWKEHLEKQNDVSVTDYLPEGMNFEIYSLKALETSHQYGGDYERSEFCSAYVRQNITKFKVGLLKPEPVLRRLDLRLTVDYPHDLILCRQIYNKFKKYAPLIPSKNIINYLNDNPEMGKIVESFLDTQPLWDSVLHGD